MTKIDFIPTRAVLGVMIFTACLVAYMLRVNMSINLIAMVEPAGSANHAGASECSATGVSKPGDNETMEIHEKLTAAPDFGVRYEWNSKIQGLILGSYFWGYIISSMPGGFLAEQFGPLKTVGVSTLVSSVLTILTPLAASWHYSVVIANRILLGLLGGVIYPALHSLISRWAPPEEKGKFVGALLGGTLGTVLTWPMLGSIVESLGWTWAFYIPGGLALLWCLLWFFLVSDSPDLHPRISDEEKFYIAKSLGDSVAKRKSIAPYKSMALSVPFWSLAVLHFGNLWGLYLLLTAGPKFMSEILGFDLGHSGLLAALPYLARMIFGFIFGLIGDQLRKSNKLSVTCIRKSFVLFSHIVPGIFLLAETAIGCDAILSVTFITLALGFNGASTITNLQNSQDLAPNFAGTIYGIANCIGGTTGFITPMLTGYLTEEKNGLYEWHLIFWVGAAVYICCGLVFCLFGSGEVQQWNAVVEPQDPESEEKSTATKATGIVNDAYIPHPEADSENTKV
ncbi:PREDICTED: sialin [Nicrophorus vespilloides]|uniref:Sialin n=1 Tax=Nicrophorus vespilloides TaxID=110193 RepID=A0ABM1MXK1_NICVS|nr:PREDICTED: sialin [Nicrophorus vespilloides]